MSRKYKIRVPKTTESRTWNEFIDSSDDGTLFHKFGWMITAAKQSRTRLYPLVCQKIPRRDRIGIPCLSI
jgi:hypothetical protein